MTQIRACPAQTKRGEGCRAAPRPTSDFCALHDPALEAKRQEGRVAGGKGSSKIARAVKHVEFDADLESVIDLTQRTIRDVYEGTLTPSQGQCIASLSGVLLKAHEIARLQGRIADLEQRAYASGRAW